MIRGRQFKSIYVFLAATSLLGFSCAKNNSQVKNAPAPAAAVIYDEEAKPTQVIPDTIPGGVSYEAPPKTLFNTTSGKNLILGQLKLGKTRVNYSAVDRRMQITGDLSILNETSKEPVAEKSFSLSGSHNEKENSFKLADADDKKMKVRAKAICLNAGEDENPDCSHVVIDLFISYNDKIYTEQLEVNREEVKPPDAVTETPETAAPSQDTSVAEIPDTQDQQGQQNEGLDESLEGRYQGQAETIDLKDLFIGDVAEVTKNKPKETPAASSETTPPKTNSSNPDIKVLTPDRVQTPQGDIRDVNQAFGFPNAGRLKNATSILTRQQALGKNAFFELIAPERKKHFGTWEMAEIITRLGEQLNRDYTKKLYVSNISAERGGKLNPHASHQMGVDVDLAYPTDTKGLKFPLVVKMSTRKYYPQNYSVEKTYNTFKFLFGQNDIKVDRIFVDQTIKAALCTHAINKKEFSGPDKDLVRNMFRNLQHVTGHGDHFHLRIKCSKFDPGCRSRVYKVMGTCGV